PAGAGGEKSVGTRAWPHYPIVAESAAGEISRFGIGYQPLRRLARLRRNCLFAAGTRPRKSADDAGVAQGNPGCPKKGRPKSCRRRASLVKRWNALAPPPPSDLALTQEPSAVKLAFPMS